MRKVIDLIKKAVKGNKIDRVAATVEIKPAFTVAETSYMDAWERALILDRD